MRVLFVAAVGAALLAAPVKAAISPPSSKQLCDFLSTELNDAVYEAWSWNETVNAFFPKCRPDIKGRDIASHLEQRQNLDQYDNLIKEKKYDLQTAGAITSLLERLCPQKNSPRLSL